MVVLARWLGPWARRGPRTVIREQVIAGEDAPIRVRHYGASGPPLVIAPGLHASGPDDPRLDRLCRALAASGYHVHAPFLPDHLQLVPGARACRDLVRVIDTCDRPATIFAISFGSRLAIHAAAECPVKVARLIVFGGFAEVLPTLTYGLTHPRRDPVTHAIAALNVLDLPSDVAAALRAFVARAQPGTCASIASDLRAALSPELRPIFDDSVGITEPSARVLAAIPHAVRLRRELDSAADAARVHCPVDIIHGADDIDIPVAQAHVLANMLPGARVHILDDYHHTGFTPGAMRGLLRQARTLLRVLRALAPAR